MATERETVTRGSGPGNPATNDRVSEVRGNDPAPSQSHLPGIGGLPGMQPGDSHRKPQEVPGKPQTVAKRAIKPSRPKSVEMSLDEQIDALNTFRKIRTKPPKVSDPKMNDLIRTLYEAWVDDQILKIIQPGLSTGTEGFTPDELQALKVLAQTILQRQAATPTQSQAAQTAQPGVPLQRQGENPNPQNAQPMIPRRLNPGVNSNAYRDAQARFLDELNKLEQVDPDAKWRTR